MDCGATCRRPGEKRRRRNPVTTFPGQGEFEQTLGPTNIYGVISGDGNLTVQNQSIDQLYLRGNNNFTGHTYISAGTVNAITNSALGTSSEGTTITGGTLIVHAAIGLSLLGFPKRSD